MGTCCTKNDDLSRGGRAEVTQLERGRLSTSDRRQTFAVNMKNFKNLKYVDNIEDVYTFGAVLGKGSFGSVNRATRKGANFDCAIKVIDKDSLNSNPMLPQLMMSELTVLKKCSHPNIMSVNELLEDDNNFYIVTELLEGGELFDRIIEEQQFDEQKAAYLLKQVLLAINYMHQKNITHRDLKPENILLESKDKKKLEVKISDFGFSCFFEPTDGLDLVLGSPLYMAPEIIRGKVYNEKVDIWSIGVITYMLLSGRNPFPGRSKQEVK
mmetsp:Transcript_34635/g.52970  ORF Transcript_34635/g.52970 Transcript_34635/m.52970 type:complete len:268 (+) Transcript_34635:26-829(+)